MTRRLLTSLPLAFLLASCATHDRDHKMVISIPEQKMIVYRRNVPIAEYSVSTSKYGLGDRRGSRATPLGKLEVAKKIGTTAAIGAVFKSRRPTGEILPPDVPGRDPIVTRILWLNGLEKCNANAYARCIYIHGTPEERKIGRPASYGCIRMRSCDIVELYNAVGIGAEVEIINSPIPASELVFETGGWALASP